MRTNWDEIRFFLAVRRAGTLAGAARELSVDQSTVSRRLVALEKSLGVRLFDRTPDGLVATAEADRMLPSAQSAEAAVHEFERLASGEDARLEGTVRVATSDELASRFLMARLGVLRERLPQITLQMSIGRGFVDLARREADIALRIRRGGLPPGEDSLIARKLADAAWAIYGARDYVERQGAPASDADLRRFELVDYDVPSPRPGEAWIKEHVGEMAVAARCETMLSLLTAVTAGHGLGVFYCFVADNEPSLVRLSGPVEWNQLWLVVHPDLQNKPRVRAVIDAVAELVQASAAVFRGDASAPATEVIRKGTKP